MPFAKKPEFVPPAGDLATTALFVKPPFIFRNVTARSFPLKANIAVLTNFCDRYLNMDIDPSIVHYAPALPYVYLTVLNYGSMAPSSVQAQNIGWISQHEVGFMVPVQRWRMENGKLVFKDWATAAPFIYVDDQLSLSTGREVYGWNKVGCRIDSGVPLWATDPRAPSREFDVSIVDFARLYAGQQEGEQPLLQVDLDASPSFTEFPPNPRNPWLPTWAITNAIANGSAFLGSALDTALSLRVRGYEDNRSVEGVLDMGAAAWRKVRSALPGTIAPLQSARRASDLADAMAGLPKLFLDNITLKQFRNPEEPNLAAYQALVNSKIGVDRLNRVGLLGDVNLLRGDISGGYTIRIRQMDSQPIIQTLGLVIDAEEESGAVAVLKPVLPTWMDVDLYYGKGDVICSRAPWGVAGPTGGWVDEQVDRISNEVQFPKQAPAHRGPIIEPEPTPPLYNTALGAATQPVAGPFHFPDVTAQVYPLLADPVKLKSLLDKSLNEPLTFMYRPGTNSPGLNDENLQKGWRFEPFGSYVYMAIVVVGDAIGQMWSSADNIGAIFTREVTFGIPVKWYDKDGNLMSVGMVEPFMYSDSGRAVTTDREVDGFNAMVATIESPRDPWLTPGGPLAKRSYLNLGVEVIPALNVGQKARQRTLIEIDERDIASEDDHDSWRVIADDWGRVVIDDLKRKARLAVDQAWQIEGAKALSLELLAHGAPINRLVLKQYRDSEELDLACYQALVHATSTVTALYDVREIDSACHLRIHRQPGHPIVDALGLKIKYTESADGAVIDILQPLRPFWARYATRDELSTVACYRAVDGPWMNVHPWFEDQRPRALEDQRPPAAPPRRLSGQKPYFRHQTATHVGARLGQKRQLHQNLRNDSMQWLRRSLTNELAWLRVCKQRCWSPEGQGTFHAALERLDLRSPAIPSLETTVAFFQGLEQAPSVLSYCDTRSIQDLLRLSDSLRVVATSANLPITDVDSRASQTEYADCADVQAVLDQWKSLGSWTKDLIDASTKGLELKNALLWSDSSVKMSAIPGLLSLNLQRFLGLSPMNREAGISVISLELRDALSKLSKYENPFSAPNPAKPVQSLADIDLAQSKLRDVLSCMNGVEDQFLDWHAPSRWLRISRGLNGRATQIIDGLDDLQTVIENILGDEWENRGKVQRRDLARARKPDQYIPDSPDIRLVGAEQGLSRWKDPVAPNDGGLWVYAPPAAVLTGPSKTAGLAAERRSDGSKTPSAGPGAASPPAVADGAPATPSPDGAAVSSPSRRRRAKRNPGS